VGLARGTNDGLRRAWRPQPFLDSRVAPDRRNESLEESERIGRLRYELGPRLWLVHANLAPVSALALQRLDPDP
jgi:hypothetical protein